VSKVFHADSDAFKGFTAESLTPLILKLYNEHKFTHILAGASAFGKALLPRVSSQFILPRNYISTVNFILIYINLFN